MTEIKKFIVIGANGAVSRAMTTLIQSMPDCKLMLTTRRPVQECVETAATDPGHINYCQDFDPLDPASLSSFYDMVQDFAGDDRYAVIMPISRFVEHKQGIQHTLQENREILDANYVAPANIMHVLIPHMLEHVGGHFMAFSCQSTQRHDPFMGSFTAAKSALESLIQTNAHEYGGAENPVIFNAVRVASVRTEFTVKSKPKGNPADYIAPTEIADIVMSILQDKYSVLKNGNIENAFKYSRSYFLDGSLNRIANQNNANDIADWKSGFKAKPRNPKLA